MADATHWQAFGACVQGTSHQKSGAPCQDACGWLARPDGLALLAAADGAGTAERSDEGAQAAVARAIAALNQALASGWPDSPDAWPDIFGEVYAQAREAVLEAAQAAGLPPRSFACTLLCAAVSPAGLATAQLGDGVAVACADDGEWFVVAEPQRGEYANETYFLVQPEALDQVEVSVLPEPVQSLAVMTDGLLRLVLDLASGRPHRPFFEPLRAFAGQVTGPAEGEGQLAAFLGSERVNARTDDDKTLVLAVRAERVPGAAGAAEADEAWARSRES
jgi:hypothetical protein